MDCGWQARCNTNCDQRRSSDRKRQHNPASTPYGQARSRTIWRLCRRSQHSAYDQWWRPIERFSERQASACYHRQRGDGISHADAAGNRGLSRSQSGGPLRAGTSLDPVSPNSAVNDLVISGSMLMDAWLQCGFQRFALYAICAFRMIRR